MKLPNHIRGITLLAMAVFLLSSILGCSKLFRSEYVGTYTSGGDPSSRDRVEIRPDGTFSIVSSGMSVSGKYSIDGNGIIFNGDSIYRNGEKVLYRGQAGVTMKGGFGAGGTGKTVLLCEAGSFIKIGN